MLDNHESSSPTIHPDFPLSVKADIEQALGIDLTWIQRPKSGMWAHTYLIGDEAHEWVVRVYKAPEPSLRRSFVVQQKAASVGMRVPKTIAHRLETSNPEDYIWVVEEHVSGSEFYPEKFDREPRLAISADIGRQLKLLHTVEVNGFGELAPNLLNAKYATWGEWLDKQETKIEPAVHIAGIRSDDLSMIKDVYDMLRDVYTGSTRLCHGDFSTDNLLVEGGRLVAAVDWENALACDPAYDVAYWCKRHEGLECLDALLSGYKPPDPGGFRQRAMAHHILLAIDFMVWYAEEEDREGVEECRKMLRKNLKIRVVPGL